MVAGEPAVAVNVAVRLFAGTLSDAGTLSIALFEDSATVTPPANAGNASVTVQVEFAPDVMLAGEHCNADTVITGGASVRDVDADVPLYEAVIAAVWLVATAPLETVKVADVEPAATATDDGILTLALLPDSVTSTPAVGAGMLIATVHMVLPGVLRIA